MGCPAGSLRRRREPAGRVCDFPNPQEGAMTEGFFEERNQGAVFRRVWTRCKELGNNALTSPARGFCKQ